MFALTNPWFLLALGGLAVPVLIHLLTRARPRVIRFPTYHLLVEAGSGRQAVHRLRTWIILLLRTLAIAAVVLAFCRPVLEAPGRQTETGEARRVVLVIDASMSMRASDGGISVFTRARAQAADLLRGLGNDTLAGVVFIGAQPRAILPALSRNLPILHEELTAAEATLERGDAEAALALAAAMLEGQGSVYVFSDFQRTNWGAVNFDRFKGLAFYLRPVIHTGIEHVGIVAVSRSPGEPVEGETIELACTVFNATAGRRQEKVRLDLEGATQEATVELPPFGSAVATFSFAMPVAGCYPGRLSLAPDDLNDDNVRCFRVLVRRALNVLLVSDADRGDATSAAFFAGTALSPSPYAATGMNVVRRHSQEVDRASLETADVFMLVPPLQAGGETLEIVGRRVTEGASLVCFLDGPDAAQTVSAVAAASGGQVVPPFQILRPVAAPSADGEPLADTVSLRGPLKIFDSPDQGDLKGLRFRRHFFTQVDDNRQDDVLLRFADGSAALSLSPAGRGAVIYANFPLSLDGSTLAASPLFPSMLHELMRELRSVGDEGMNVPGRAWHVDVPASGDGDTTPYRVEDPAGRPVEATIVSRGRTVRLALPPASLPGHYNVTQGDALVDVGVVCPDPKETDTRELDLVNLLADGGPQGAAVSVVDDQGELVRVGQSVPLWHHFAAAAVVCFAAEMLLLALWRRKPSKVLARSLEGRAS